MKEENLRKFHGRFLEYFTENWFRTVSVIGQSGAVFLRHLKKKQFMTRPDPIPAPISSFYFYVLFFFYISERGRFVRDLHRNGVQ